MSLGYLDHATVVAVAAPAKLARNNSCLCFGKRNCHAAVWAHPPESFLGATFRRMMAFSPQSQTMRRPVSEDPFVAAAGDTFGFGSGIAFGLRGGKETRHWLG